MTYLSTSRWGSVKTDMRLHRQQFAWSQLSDHMRAYERQQPSDGGNFLKYQFYSKIESQSKNHRLHRIFSMFQKIRVKNNRERFSRKSISTLFRHLGEEFMKQNLWSWMAGKSAPCVTIKHYCQPDLQHTGPDVVFYMQIRTYSKNQTDDD